MVLFVFLFTASLQNVSDYESSLNIVAEAAETSSSVFNGTALSVSSLGVPQTIMVDSATSGSQATNNAAMLKMGLQTQWGNRDVFTRDEVDANGRWCVEYPNTYAGQNVFIWARYLLDDDLINIRRSGSLYISAGAEQGNNGTADTAQLGVGKAGLTDAGMTTSSTPANTMALLGDSQAVGGWFWWICDDEMPAVEGTLTSDGSANDAYVYLFFIARADAGAGWCVEDWRFTLSYQTGNAIKANENHSKVGGVTPSSIGSLGDAEYLFNATSGTFTELTNSAANFSFVNYSDYYYLRADEIVTGYRFVGWLETSSASPPVADMDRSDFTYNTTLASARTEIQSKITGYVAWHNGTSSSGYNTLKIGRVAGSGNTRIIGGHNITAVYVPLQYEIRFTKSGTTEEYDQWVPSSILTNLRVNTITNGDSIFLGWKSNPGGNAYVDEAAVVNLISCPEANINATDYFRCDVYIIMEAQWGNYSVGSASSITVASYAQISEGIMWTITTMSPLTTLLTILFREFTLLTQAVLYRERVLFLTKTQILPTRMVTSFLT
jgi:hypothetical protein